MKWGARRGYHQLRPFNKDMVMFFAFRSFDEASRTWRSGKTIIESLVLETSCKCNEFFCDSDKNCAESSVQPIQIPQLPKSVSHLKQLSMQMPHEQITSSVSNLQALIASLAILCFFIASVITVIICRFYRGRKFDHVNHSLGNLKQ